MRDKDFIRCGDDIVAWASGHLLELCEPEDYDPAYRKWSRDTLLYVPEKWKLKEKGYPSILVSEPGLGKTILVQRLVCDLSVGGPVWGGFSSSPPQNTLMFCGEAGLGMLNERLESAGWNFDRERIKILDSRAAWKGGLYPALDTDEGREVFRGFIEDVKPDLVVIDSLGSFVEDESGREAMKSVFDFLLSTGDRYGCAHLLAHHLRKRKNNERSLPLDMSEVIGSSVITRHSALVTGMEKRRRKDPAAGGRG
ncbi:MAG: AAA family ATPase [Synergistaceae bacterium]|jgi:RecA-family ATPase|nr:AAA family ATPase [Synergistaceae bacterium]